MRLCWSDKRSTIGLDIGRTSLKAAQVTATDQGTRLDGVLSLPRSSVGASLDSDEVRGLCRALDRRGIKASQVVLIAPTDALVGGSINVPPTNVDVPRDKIVEMELARTYNLSESGFEFAWWDLPASSNGQSVGQAQAVALPHAAVADTLETLGKSGMETVQTIPASLALLSVVQRRPVDPRRISAVLDLGSHRAHLVLLHTGRVVHERPLPDFDLSVLRKELSESLGVDQDSAGMALGRFGLRDEPDGKVAFETTALLADVLGPLTEEIGMSFAYVSHLYPDAELGPLLLTGGGANLPGLVMRIAQTLELETSVISPSTVLTNECFGSEAGDPALAAATGAALIGSEGA